MKCCCDSGSVSFVLYFQILYKLKSFISKQYFVHVITCTSYFYTCYNMYFWVVQVITCTKLQHVHDIYIYCRWRSSYQEGVLESH
jgi:hypothetical protein